MSNPPDHKLERYGFDQWELSWPEAHGSSGNNLGVYRDVGFSDLVWRFLQGEALGMNYNRALAEVEPSGGTPAPTQPWLAVASFLNPHDIAAHPALPRGVDPNAKPLGPLSVPEKGTLSNPPTAGTMWVDLNPLGFLQETALPPPASMRASPTSPVASSTTRTRWASRWPPRRRSAPRSSFPCSTRSTPRCCPAFPSS